MIIDADTIETESEGVDADGLLLGLLSEGSISAYEYSDDGPPIGTPVMESEWFPPANIGWLVAKPLEDSESIASHELIYCDGDRRTQGAIVAGRVEAVTSRITRPGEENASASTLEMDALALLAANDAGADIFVTKRPSLLVARPTITPSLTVVSPIDALPLVGLYLRSHGIYLRSKGKRITFASRKGLFFSSAVQLHIPSARDVVSRSIQLDDIRRTDSLGGLSISAMRRAGRALERRDVIWRLVNQEQNAEVAEDTLTTLDAFLMFLMGSLDATARLAHKVLDIQGSSHSAGWQNKTWLKIVDREASKLAGVFCAGSRAAAALNVLVLLRNTIHDEGLDSVSVGEPHRIEATWISLPRAEGAKVVEAADQIATRDYWGLRETSEGYFYAEPGPLMDAILAETLQTLGDVFLQLDGILSELTVKPLAEEKSKLNENLLGQHLLWQLGLPAKRI